MDRWKNLLTDEQVHIPDAARGFESFVNKVLPEILCDILSKEVTPETLMEAQHRVLQTLALRDGKDQPQYQRHLDQLSGYSSATKDLQALGYTAEDFFRRVPGFSDEEIRQINLGKMTIGDVMNIRPAVLLRPLLATQKH